MHYNIAIVVVDKLRTKLLRQQYWTMQVGGRP